MSGCGSARLSCWIIALPVAVSNSCGMEAPFMVKGGGHTLELLFASCQTPMRVLDTKHAVAGAPHRRRGLAVESPYDVCRPCARANGAEVCAGSHRGGARAARPAGGRGGDRQDAPASG